METLSQPEVVKPKYLYLITAGVVVIPGYVGPAPDYIWNKGEVLGVGSTVELTEEDARGIGVHRVRRVDTTTHTPVSVPVSPTTMPTPVPAPIPTVATTAVAVDTDWTFVSTMTVPDVVALIDSINDVDSLSSIYEAEKASLDRKGVLNRALSRIATLRGGEK